MLISTPFVVAGTAYAQDTDNNVAASALQANNGADSPTSPSSSTASSSYEMLSLSEAGSAQASDLSAEPESSAEDAGDKKSQEDKKSPRKKAHTIDSEQLAARRTEALSAKPQSATAPAKAVSDMSELEVAQLLENPYADNLGLYLKAELTTPENQQALRQKVEEMAQKESKNAAYYRGRLADLFSAANYLNENREALSSTIIAAQGYGDPEADKKRTQQYFKFDSRDYTGLFIDPQSTPQLEGTDSGSGTKGRIQLEVFVDFQGPDDQKNLRLSLRQFGQTDVRKSTNLNYINVQLKQGYNKLSLTLSNRKNPYAVYLRNHGNSPALVRIQSADFFTSNKKEAADKTQPGSAAPLILGQQLGLYPVFELSESSFENYYDFTQHVITANAERRAQSSQQGQGVIVASDSGIKRANLADLRIGRLDLSSGLQVFADAYTGIDTKEAAIELAKKSYGEITDRFAFFDLFEGMDSSADFDSPHAPTNHQVVLLTSSTVGDPSTMFATHEYYHMPFWAATASLKGNYEQLYSWSNNHEYGHLLDNSTWVELEMTNNVYSIEGALRKYERQLREGKAKQSIDKLAHINVLTKQNGNDTFMNGIIEDPEKWPDYMLPEGSWERSEIFLRTITIWSAQDFFKRFYDYSQYDYDAQKKDVKVSKPFTQERAELVKKYGVWGTALRVMREDPSWLKEIVPSEGQVGHNQRVMVALSYASGFNLGEFFYDRGYRSLTQPAKDFMAQYPSVPKELRYYAPSMAAKEIENRVDKELGKQLVDNPGKISLKLNSGTDKSPKLSGDDETQIQAGKQKFAVVPENKSDTVAVWEVYDPSGKLLGFTRTGYIELNIKEPMKLGDLSVKSLRASGKTMSFIEASTLTPAKPIPKPWVAIKPFPELEATGSVIVLKGANLEDSQIVQKLPVPDGARARVESKPTTESEKKEAAKVRVEFEDGSSKVYEVPVEVRLPWSSIIAIPTETLSGSAQFTQGDEISVDKLQEQLSLPEGASLRLVDGQQLSTAEAGDKSVDLWLVYADGSSRRISQSYTVTEKLPDPVSPDPVDPDPLAPAPGSEINPVPDPAPDPVPDPAPTVDPAPETELLDPEVVPEVDTKEDAKEDTDVKPLPDTEDPDPDSDKETVDPAPELDRKDVEEAPTPELPKTDPQPSTDQEAEIKQPEGEDKQPEEKQPEEKLPESEDKQPEKEEGDTQDGDLTPPSGEASKPEQTEKDELETQPEVPAPSTDEDAELEKPQTEETKPATELKDEDETSAKLELPAEESPEAIQPAIENENENSSVSLDTKDSKSEGLFSRSGYLSGLLNLSASTNEREAQDRTLKQEQAQSQSKGQSRNQGRLLAQKSQPKVQQQTVAQQNADKPSVSGSEGAASNSLSEAEKQTDQAPSNAQSEQSSESSSSEQTSTTAAKTVNKEERSALWYLLAIPGIALVLALIAKLRKKNKQTSFAKDFSAKEFKSPPVSPKSFRRDFSFGSMIHKLPQAVYQLTLLRSYTSFSCNKKGAGFLQHPILSFHRISGVLLDLIDKL